jgi:hypothetical protein
MNGEKSSLLAYCRISPSCQRIITPQQLVEHMGHDQDALRHLHAGEGKLVVHIQLHHHHLRLILSTHLPVRQAVEIKNK